MVGCGSSLLTAVLMELKCYKSHIRIRTAILQLKCYKITLELIEISVFLEFNLVSDTLYMPRFMGYNQTGP